MFCFSNLFRLVHFLVCEHQLINNFINTSSDFFYSFILIINESVPTFVCRLFHHTSIYSFFTYDDIQCFIIVSDIPSYSCFKYNHRFLRRKLVSHQRYKIKLWVKPMSACQLLLKKNMVFFSHSK